MMKNLTIFASFPTVPLTDHLPNGDGLVAYNAVCRLARRGHTIYVATPKAELSAPFEGDVHLLEMNNGTARPSAFAYMRWTRKVLREICKKDRIDLIHELNPVFSLRSLAFRGCGIPVVLGPHSSRWPDRDAQGESISQILQRRAQAVLKDFSIRCQHRRAHAVLLSTIAALNNVRSPEELAGKLFILPPGIDTDVFSPNAEVQVTQPTILFLANVTARKGIFTLVDAFFRLHQPDVRLLVAGDGPDLEEAKKRVAAAHLQERVDFLGRVSRGEVPHLMQKCSVYCLPSYGEPFGMSAIEAMACGKPLVVTQAGGLAHLVSERGGRLVETGNPGALAMALQELLLQPDLCRRMGEYNRAEVESKYAWPVVAARLERIYRHVLSNDAEENPDLITDECIGRYRESTVRQASIGRDANHVCVGATL